MAFLRCLSDKWRVWIAVGLDWRLRNLIVTMTDAINEYTFPPIFFKTTVHNEAIHNLPISLSNDDIGIPQDWVTNLFGKLSSAYHRMHVECHGDP